MLIIHAGYNVQVFTYNYFKSKCMLLHVVYDILTVKTLHIDIKKWTHVIWYTQRDKCQGNMVIDINDKLYALGKKGKYYVTLIN